MYEPDEEHVPDFLSSYWESRRFGGGRGEGGGEGGDGGGLGDGGGGAGGGGGSGIGGVKHLCSKTER